MVRSPAGNKKAAGNADTTGTYASKVLSFQRNHALETTPLPWVPFTNCQKKGGSLIPPRTTHRPLTEGNKTKVTEEIPRSRRHHNKTSLVWGNQKKGGFPSPSLDDAFTPSEEG